MIPIKSNFTTSGKPPFLALKSVKALDVQARVIWEQKRMPQGTEWQIIRTNVNLDSDYVKEGFYNLYVPTHSQQDAMNEANAPSFTNPFATINDVGGVGIWWVKSGKTITIGEINENVVTEMRVDGSLIIDGKLTVI